MSQVQSNKMQFASIQKCFSNYKCFYKCTQYEEMYTLVYRGYVILLWIKETKCFFFPYSSQQCKQLGCILCHLLIITDEMRTYLYVVFLFYFLRKYIVSLHFVGHSCNHWIKNSNSNCIYSATFLFVFFTSKLDKPYFPFIWFLNIGFNCLPIRKYA